MTIVGNNEPDGRLGLAAESPGRDTYSRAGFVGMSKKAVDSGVQGRLRELLRDDLLAGALVLSETLVVSRRHYAERLGLSYGFVSAKGTAVFKEYDAQVYVRLVERCRSVLERALQERVLPIRDGKVERGWLRNELGVSATLLQTRKELRALVSEFDGRIYESEYSPRSTAALLGKVTRILENHCPLAVGQKRIAVREVARRAGCAHSLLKQEPFASAMRAKSDALKAGECLQDGDVIVAGRVMAFSPLKFAWPMRFVLRIAQAFQTFAAPYAERANEYRRELLTFLQWLDHPTDAFRLSAKEALAKSAWPDARTWRGVLDSYEVHIDSSRGARAPATLSNRLGKLNRMLSALAADGVFPSPHRKLRLRETTRRSPEARRSLAELSHPLDEKADALVAFAEKTLHGASTRFPTDYQEDGAKEFLRCLRAEFIRKGGSLPGNLPEAVLLVLDERLSLIARAVQSAVDESKGLLAQGRALLLTSNLPGDFLERFAEAACAGEEARRLLLRRHFPPPVDGVPSELAQANLLALVKTHCGGIFPDDADGGHRLSAFLGPSFFRKRYLETGGRLKLQSLLTVTPDVRAAVATGYMATAGANVALALGLWGERMRPSREVGHTEVIGIKDKAGGKPIHADLPTKSPCIAAMQWLWGECAALRASATGESRNLLFITNRGEKFNAAWFRCAFKRLMNRTPELSGLPISPSMLRPSVLLKAALEHDGRVLTGQAIAQHGLNLSASGAYQGRRPTRELWDEQMRRFQVAFETCALLAAEEVSPVRGYTERERAERVSRLEATGLGTFCRDRFGRPGHEGRRCESLDCLGGPDDETCCPQMEVNLCPDSAALMQIWKAALDQAESDWVRDREERWVKVWMPWQAFITVVQEKASRGPLLRVWTQGKSVRRQLELQNGYAEPCPF